jgi:hypothetical protein
VLLVVAGAHRPGAAALAQALAALAVGAVPEQVERRGQRLVVHGVPDRRVEAAMDVERVLAERLELVRPQIRSDLGIGPAALGLALRMWDASESGDRGLL